jgi:DNA-directed RNA polymerase specialized sigma24 family protein
MRSPDQLIGDYRGIIINAAIRFRRAAEYDDLYQEGMIALWLCPPDTILLLDNLRSAGDGEDAKLASTIIHRRMKKWVRYIKRLRHNHAVSYESILDDEREEVEHGVYD